MGAMHGQELEVARQRVLAADDDAVDDVEQAVERNRRVAPTEGDACVTALRVDLRAAGGHRPPWRFPLYLSGPVPAYR